MDANTSNWSSLIAMFPADTMNVSTRAARALGLDRHVNGWHVEHIEHDVWPVWIAGQLHPHCTNLRKSRRTSHGQKQTQPVQLEPKWHKSNDLHTLHCYFRTTGSVIHECPKPEANQTPNPTAKL